MTADGRRRLRAEQGKTYHDGAGAEHAPRGGGLAQREHGQNQPRQRRSCRLDHYPVTDALGITKSGESPKGLTAGFRTILSRVGYFGSQHHIPRDPTLAKDAEPDLKKFLEEDLKQVFMASSFKAGGEKNQPWIKHG